jgi:flagellar basal-body rod modification protein FlgD
MSTVSTVSASSSSATTAASAMDTSLDKEAFLKLLVTQLQNQDPLDPMDNQEYLAQLAQFSSLEQLTNISQVLDTVSGNSTFSGALNMTGKWIEYTDSDGNTQTGQVDGVSLGNGNVTLMVGDTLVDLDHVLSVYSSEPQS